MMNIGGVPPEEVDKFHDVDFREYQLVHGDPEPESMGAWAAHPNMGYRFVDYELTRRYIQGDGVKLDMGSWTAHDVRKMNLGFVNYHLTRSRDGVPYELDETSLSARHVNNVYLGLMNRADQARLVGVRGAVQRRSCLRNVTKFRDHSSHSTRHDGEKTTPK